MTPPIVIPGAALRRWASPFIVTCILLTLFACESIAQNPPRAVPIDGLIYDLKSPDPVRRKEAAKALGDSKVQKATPDLAAIASDPDAAVRREVVAALDKMADLRAIPAFVTLSKDAEKDIRERAVQGILDLYLPRESGVGDTVNKVANFFNPWSDEWSDVTVDPGVAVDPSAVTALQERLQDSEEAIRAKAARVLGIVRGRAAIAALTSTLQQDRSNAVRFEAVRSLRKIGDPAVSRDLIGFLSYSDAKIRSECIYALGRFRYKDAVPELTRLYEKESSLPPKQADKAVRERLLDALAFIADPSSKELFFKEQSNLDETLRLRAFEGLARIGDPSMVTDLSRSHLSEKDARIQTAQSFALYRMGRKEYLDVLVAALSSRKTRDGARQYLVEFRPAELPELYAQIRNKDVGVRAGLAEVFGLIGDAGAIVPLQELAKDKRGEIASIANQGLRRLNARGVTP
jgi:HEAT repeat protein